MIGDTGKKVKEIFGLSTVRKKVLMLSKLVGAVIVLFYLITIELSTDSRMAFFWWFALMVAVILGVDFFLGRMISKPLNKIKDAAGRMAELDFTAHCDVHTDDEFGELSHSLNIMSENLKNALDRLETANRQLECEVEKERLLLVQRKELADSLSHEMKTPLGLIQAYTEGLREETDEAVKERYMDAILSAAQRMNKLIVSLLDLSALEAGAVKLAKEQFDFVELVETVAGRLLTDTPGREYYFTYRLPREPLFVCCDKQRMEQVLNCLIENARKYARRGGEIQIEVSVPESGKLYFSVFNQGPTVPEQELGKIWEKFYRSKDAQKSGSGLGLAAAAQILSMYNAEYGALNKAEGMLFYFYFPISL